MNIYILIKSEHNQCGTHGYTVLGTYKSLKDAQEVALIDSLSEDLKMSEWEMEVGVDDTTEYVATCSSRYYSCTYKVHKSLLTE